MRELLAGIVPGLPERTAARILERAEGIPLYAVETVRMLVQEGRLERTDGVYRPVGSLETVAVPETLEAGIFPGDATFAVLADRMDDAFRLIRVGVAPVVPNLGLIAILALLMWMLGGLFSQGASPGFIELWSLQSRMAYRVRQRRA